MASAAPSAPSADQPHFLFVLSKEAMVESATERSWVDSWLDRRRFSVEMVDARVDLVTEAVAASRKLDVVHISAHGSAAELQFDDALLDADRLAALLRPAGHPPVGLLFLSACTSERLAAEMVRRGVARYALAYPRDVSSARANAFFADIYTQLAENISVPIAFANTRDGYTASAASGYFQSGFGADLTAPIRLYRAPQEATADGAATAAAVTEDGIGSDDPPLFVVPQLERRIRNQPVDMWKWIPGLSDRDRSAWRPAQEDAIAGWLHAAYAAPTGGPKNLLVVGDEPGVGSSTLVARAVKRAIAAGCYAPDTGLGGAFWVPPDDACVATDANTADGQAAALTRWYSEQLHGVLADRGRGDGAATADAAAAVTPAAATAAATLLSDLEKENKLLMNGEKVITVRGVEPGPLPQRVAHALAIGTKNRTLRSADAAAKLSQRLAQPGCKPTLLVFDDCEYCPCLQALDAAAVHDSACSHVEIGRCVPADLLPLALAESHMRTAADVAVNTSACPNGSQCPVAFMRRVYGAHEAFINRVPVQPHCHLGGSKTAGVGAGGGAGGGGSVTAAAAEAARAMKIHCIIICNRGRGVPEPPPPMPYLGSGPSDAGSSDASGGNTPDLATPRDHAPSPVTPAPATAGPLVRTETSVRPQTFSAHVHRVYCLQPLQLAQAAYGCLALLADPEHGKGSAAHHELYDAMVKYTKYASFSDDTSGLFKLSNCRQAPEQEMYALSSPLAFTRGNARALTLLLRLRIWMLCAGINMPLVEVTPADVQACYDVATQRIPQADLRAVLPQHGSGRGGSSSGGGGAGLSNRDGADGPMTSLDGPLTALPLSLSPAAQLVLHGFPTCSDFLGSGWSVVDVDSAHALTQLRASQGLTPWWVDARVSRGEALSLLQGFVNNQWDGLCIVRSSSAKDAGGSRLYAISQTVHMNDKQQRVRPRHQDKGTSTPGVAAGCRPGAVCTVENYLLRLEASSTRAELVDPAGRTQAMGALACAADYFYPPPPAPLPLPFAATTADEATLKDNVAMKDDSTAVAGARGGAGSAPTPAPTPAPGAALGAAPATGVLYQHAGGEVRVLLVPCLKLFVRMRRNRE